MHLAMVMVYDLLYGKGIQCGGALKQAILRHREELRGAARRAQEERSKTPENEEEGKNCSKIISTISTRVAYVGASPANRIIHSPSPCRLLRCS